MLWPILILMPFLSSFHNLLCDACIIFQKGVDDFEIEHNTMLIFWLGVQYPLNGMNIVIALV